MIFALVNNTDGILGTATDVCTGGKELQECASACPLTCANYASPPLECIQPCCISKLIPTHIEGLHRLYLASFPVLPRTRFTFTIIAGVKY